MSNSTNKEYFQGGYFIYQPCNGADFFNEPSEIMVTLPNIHSLKESILELINSAEKSIKLCSFIISDPDVYSSLLEVLKTKDIAVFILTQLDSSKLSMSLLSEEERTPNFHQKHIDYISKLYSYGAHVRAAKAAHAKFIIADNSKGLLMSSNITEPSLTINPESGVYIKDVESLNSLIKLFDIIFQYGTEFTKFKSASKDKQFIVSREVNLKPEWIEGISYTDLKFTWGDIDNSLYENLIEIINSSSKDETILISTYSVVGLGNIPELVEKIEKFISSGGAIKLFCRGMNYRPDHLRNCTILASKGVKIFGDLYNHSKGIVSKTSTMIFTANIDGNHGLINGFEVGFVMSKTQSEALKEFIEWQIASAPYKFILNPLKKDFYETYGFYLTKKNISLPMLPENLVIEIEDNAVLNSLEDYPAYVLYDNRNSIRHINIGEQFYDASITDNKLTISDKCNRVFGMETYLLDITNIEITTIKNTTI